MSATLAEVGKIVMLAAITAGIGLHLYREDRKDRAMTAWKIWSITYKAELACPEIQAKWQADWDRMILQPEPHGFMR